METKQHKIIVYSTNTCPYCDMVKNFFRENNIKFTDINVQESKEKAKEMIKKSGQMGVPVIDIDGHIMVGFDKHRLKELLGMK